MFYKKQGLPEESELVLCTVKKILPHSTFVILDEYNNKEGMIHISEISPGRIRNIRDFVKEGKKLVCKVLKINKEKNHIDLSLRRVSLSMRKNKLEEIKQLKRAEKLLEQLARDNKTVLEKIYEKIGYQIIDNFGSLYNCFEEILNNKTKLVNIKAPQKLKDQLIELVKEKIKLPEVTINKKIKIQSYDSNGIEVIKNILKSTSELAKKDKYQINITYLGAPNYSIAITANNPKEAQTEMQKLSSFITESIKKNKGVVEIYK